MTVGKWRRRFLPHGVDRLPDEPRSDAPRTIDDARAEAVVARALESQPEGASHWISRCMARAGRLLVTTMQRIQRAFGLQPHARETIKLSSLTGLTEARDVVALYLSPPGRRVGLGLDERTRIQPLDRRHYVMPMRPDQSQGRSHDRRGTTFLFGALNTATIWFLLPCNRQRYEDHDARQRRRCFVYAIPGCQRNCNVG